MRGLCPFEDARSSPAQGVPKASSAHPVHNLDTEATSCYTSDREGPGEGARGVAEAVARDGSHGTERDPQPGAVPTAKGDERDMQRPRTGTRRLRCRMPIAAASALAAAAALTIAAPAFAAKVNPEFAEFLDCPAATAAICTVAHTTSGEFKMGNKEVPIEKEITLQGGLPTTSFETQKLIGARDGKTVISPPQKVPGGLLGIPGILEGIGGEVTATASLAGPASGIEVNQFNLLSGKGTAVVLPLKIKLDNPLLGSECMVGSETEPVVLHLMTTVKGVGSAPGKRKITELSGITLEDNQFAVPAAKNCGLSTLLVNLLAGLPSPAGHNRAVLTGDFESTPAEYAEKYAIIPQEKQEAKEKKSKEKQEKKEQKEKEKRG